MSLKILKKKEIERGFILIPVADRTKFADNRTTPFRTKVNGLPARFDKQGRLWSKCLKNRYPINSIVKIEKNEEGFLVTSEGKNGEQVEQARPSISITEMSKDYPPSTSDQSKNHLDPKIVMIDASNVAYWGLPEIPATGYPIPSYDQIVSAETYFKKQGFHVLMYADPSLMRYIDKKYEFRKREKAKEIRISPPDVEADVNILNVAIMSYPKALVVTNDKYYDHPELLRKFRQGGGRLVRFDTESKKFIPMTSE